MIIVVEGLYRTHHNKNLTLLNFYEYIFIPGCVPLMEILRSGIAKHHALEVVSKSQPLKLNSERALTPAVCWQIRLVG